MFRLRQVLKLVSIELYTPAESTDRAEILVTEGDADGGMAMAEAAEKFREDHDKLHAELTTPERTKSVCEVCGVFVNSTDNEQRRLVCLSS